jgi:hypothetical protein
LALNKPSTTGFIAITKMRKPKLQKSKIFVISILAALLVSGTLSITAAQEIPQVPTPSGDVISYAPRTQGEPAPQIEYAPTINIPLPKEDIISYVPRPQGQPVPSVASATITGPDGETTTVANVTLPAPIYEKDGIPAFDVNGNGQAITGQNGSDEPIYIAPRPGMGDVVPIYALNESTADNSSPAAAATAVGLVVAALAMGAVGIVCLSKHP